MKRLPFEPPTEHYDERIQSIDEQICALIKERKVVSDQDPGFPAKKLISAWSDKYDFQEDFLNSVFSHFLNEDLYRPVVEPEGFVKNIPVLKSFENKDVFYSITFIRQYENASVVHFNIDREYREEDMHRGFQDHTFFELSIQGLDTEYDCRNDGGGGSRGHESYTYIISPALPDDLSTFTLVFKEHKTPYQKPTGLEVLI
ncbi:hypothetical protein [Bacillus tuaregi]|uniref:hypothetical protein n=1 Tax=Bacillus tuaregi TaxID=1816695 RepID=UPI0008F84037|nr:hypothetical protein [Bacillus tuaregi]